MSDWVLLLDTHIGVLMCFSTPVDTSGQTIIPGRISGTVGIKGTCKVQPMSELITHKRHIQHITKDTITTKTAKWGKGSLV